MKKRLVCLALALCCMAALLCGCAGAKTPPVAVARGTVSGSTYTGGFTQLNGSFPEQWVLRSAEDNAAERPLADNAPYFDEADPGRYSQQALNTAGVYDLSATDAANGSTLYITIENMQVVANGEETTEEDYFALQQQAMADVQPEFGATETAAIGGKQYAVKTIAFSSADARGRQLLCVRKEGGYMVVIRYTVIGEPQVSDLTAIFG